MVWLAIREISLSDPRTCVDVAGRPVVVEYGNSKTPDEDSDPAPAPRVMDDPYATLACEEWSSCPLTDERVVPGPKPARDDACVLTDDEVWAGGLWCLSGGFLRPDGPFIHDEEEVRGPRYVV